MLFLISQTLSPISSQISSLEKLLLNLPDVSFKEIESLSGFEVSYELRVKQPLDHSDHLKGFFYQKVIYHILDSMSLPCWLPMDTM